MNKYREMTYLVIIVSLALLCVVLAGTSLILNQQRIASDPDLDAAMHQLAPEGGAGVKEYSYDSGTVKLRDHWRDFRLAEKEFYDPSGQCIYSSDMSQGTGLTLELNEQGEILEICMWRNNHVEGYFVFKELKLREIHQPRVHHVYRYGAPTAVDQNF